VKRTGTAGGKKKKPNRAIRWEWLILGELMFKRDQIKGRAT